MFETFNKSNGENESMGQIVSAKGCFTDVDDNKVNKSLVLRNQNTLFNRVKPDDINASTAKDTNNVVATAVFS